MRGPMPSMGPPPPMMGNVIPEQADLTETETISDIVSEISDFETTKEVSMKGKGGRRKKPNVSKTEVLI